MIHRKLLFVDKQLTKNKTYLKITGLLSSDSNILTKLSGKTPLFPPSVPSHHPPGFILTL